MQPDERKQYTVSTIGIRNSCIRLRTHDYKVSCQNGWSIALAKRDHSSHSNNNNGNIHSLHVSRLLQGHNFRADVILGTKYMYTHTCGTKERHTET